VLAQDDYTVKVDWKIWNFRWRSKMDRVSIERMCAGREFQVEGGRAMPPQLPSVCFRCLSGDGLSLNSEIRSDTE